MSEQMVVSCYFSPYVCVCMRGKEKEKENCHRYIPLYYLFRYWPIAVEGTVSGLSHRARSVKSRRG